MKKKINLVKLTSGLLVGVGIAICNPVDVVDVAKATTTETEIATPEEKSQLLAEMPSLSKIEDWNLASEELKEQYTNIRKSVQNLVKDENTTKSQVTKKLEEIQSIKERLLQSIENNKNGSINSGSTDSNSTSQLATSEDKARLSEIAVAPSKIEDYSLANSDIATEYSNARKEALVLIRDDNATKSQIEEKINQIQEIKTRLLKSITDEKNPNNGNDNGTNTTNESNVEIYMLKDTEFTLTNNEREVITQIFGSNLTDDIKILVKEITSSGEVDSSDVTLGEITGTNKKKTVKLNVENNSTQNKTYKIYLGYGTVTSNSTHIVNITKEGKQENTTDNSLVVNSFTSLSNGKKISASDAVVELNINGKNLNNSNISFEILKNGVAVNDIIQTFNSNNSSAESLLYTLQFPNNETTEELNYTVKLKVDGQYVDTISDLTFVMRGKVDENIVVSEITPINATISANRKNITITFSENLIVGVGNLEDNIFIATGVRGNARDINFKKLGLLDLAVINDNKLNILLNSPLDSDAPYYRIKIAEKALKNSQNIHNAEIIKMLDVESSQSKPNITDYKVKNPILTNSGGIVEVEIIGDNLRYGENATRIRVTDVNNHTVNEEITNSIVYTEENGKLIAKITLPENISDVTNSYSLTFYNYLEQMFRKATRSDVAILSVVPKNKTEKDITVSNVTITSYASTTEAKHTVAERNQESKKTYVRIYGTNLETDLTKIRIFDSNGVEWPIRSAGSNVDGTAIMMVTLNVRGEGTGIEGEGNYQLLEVILPNNLSEDMTFTYHISVDGSGKLNEHIVTATVEAVSASSQKVSLNKRKIIVKYVDEENNEIKNSKELIGYSWFKYNIPKEEIEGYKFYNLSSNEKFEGIFGDVDKEIVLVYKRISQEILNKDKEGSTRDNKVITTTETDNIIIIEDNKKQNNLGNDKIINNYKKVLSNTGMTANNTLVLGSLILVAGIVLFRKKLKN